MLYLFEEKKLIQNYNFQDILFTRINRKMIIYVKKIKQD
jgi:hypothetical protein